MGILVEGALIPSALAIGWVLGIPALADFRWTTQGVIWGVVATLPPLAVFALTLNARWNRLSRIRRFLEGALRPLVRDAKLWELFLLCSAAGIGEEMLFRGVVQGAAARLLGLLPALGIASVLFGLCHPITPAYAVIVGVIGVYLGLAWHFSGNLLVPVIAHGLYDFVALLIFRLHRRGHSPQPDQHHPGGDRHDPQNAGRGELFPESEYPSQSGHEHR
jgi:membrane protease YdiL (CAAX protease family)